MIRKILLSLITLLPCAMMGQIYFSHDSQERNLYLLAGNDTLAVLNSIDQIGTWYSGSLPFVRDSYVGLIDSSLSFILHPTYHLCDSELAFSDGLLKVSKGNEGVGFINEKGIERFTLSHLCSCCFDKAWASSFKNGFSISYNGYWQISDTSGKTYSIFSEETLITRSLDAHFNEYNSQGIVLFKTSDGLYGVLMNGNVAIAPVYTEIIVSQSASEGVQFECTNDQDGLSAYFFINSSRDTVREYKRE